MLAPSVIAGSGGSEEAVQHAGTEFQRLGRDSLVHTVEQADEVEVGRQPERGEREGGAAGGRGARPKHRLPTFVHAWASAPPLIRYGTARAPGSSATRQACMASTR